MTKGLGKCSCCVYSRHSKLYVLLITFYTNNGFYCFLVQNVIYFLHALFVLRKQRSFNGKQTQIALSEICPLCSWSSFTHWLNLETDDVYTRAMTFCLYMFHTNDV